MPFIIIVILSMALMGCGSEDSKSSPATVEEITYAGLWVGTTAEDTSTTDIPTYLLFNEDTVYILREDETQIGSYIIEANGLLTITADVFVYAAPDAINQFFIGDDNAQNLILSALIVTDEDIVINYNTTTRAGRTTLTLDTAQTTSIETSTVAGSWKTTDSTMDISSDGGFSGWNGATSCQWQGKLSKFNDTLLKMNIERENCTEFDIADAEGLAFVDGDGALHFLAQDNTDFLWQRFDPVAVTAPAATTTP